MPWMDFACACVPKIRAVDIRATQWLSRRFAPTRTPARLPVLPAVRTAQFADVRLELYQGRTRLAKTQVPLWVVPYWQDPEGEQGRAGKGEGRASKGQHGCSGGGGDAGEREGASEGTVPVGATWMQRRAGLGHCRRAVH